MNEFLGFLGLVGGGLLLASALPTPAGDDATLGSIGDNPGCCALRKIHVCQRGGACSPMAFAECCQTVQLTSTSATQCGLQWVSDPGWQMTYCQPDGSCDTPSCAPLFL